MHIVWSITLRWIFWVDDEIIGHMGFSFRLDFICAILELAVISFVIFSLSFTFFVYMSLISFCHISLVAVLAQNNLVIAFFLILSTRICVVIK